MYNPSSNQLQSIEKKQHDHIQSKIPRINNSKHTYIGVLGDRSQMMGPIGINKAEKELIQRRYKANAHGQASSLNRISPG